MWICPCTNLDCRECLTRYVQEMEKLGSLSIDNKLYHEWINLIYQENIEEELWEMVKRDYDPETLSALLKNPNEW